MKSSQVLLPAAFCSLGFLVIASSIRAETRVFTDMSGRTIRGELVSVSGDQVTIKREDGQAFTVRATNFSKADIEYFKKNGLKEGATPFGGVVGAAPIRVAVKIFSGKQEQQSSKVYYEKEQKVAYRVEVRNTEPKRDLEKAHAVLMVFAKLVRYNEQTQVITREEFDCDIKALATFNHDMQKPLRLRFDAEDSYWGLRASGYLLVLKDASGKVLNVTGSSENLAKNQEALLKLKLNDIFTKDYKFLKDGLTSYIN